MNEEYLHRLEQLETRLAFQDDTIDQLNQEITAQGAEIARLKEVQGAAAQPDRQPGGRNPAAPLLR